ncbi:hypothetical protein M1C57_05660 [Rhodococcus pyridinivorans]|nr:hypothetical protein M1C57_05660 [Rhodococcus pyridinivorans]
MDEHGVHGTGLGREHDRHPAIREAGIHVARAIRADPRAHTDGVAGRRVLSFSCRVRSGRPREMSWNRR